MAVEVARLVPLHEAAAPFHQLPQEGTVKIGRRANCTVVLSDGAVSGLHCVLQRVSLEPLTFQVEDKSTNGTFVNEVRVAKGECAKLVHGDVLSLGKITEDVGPASIRPQFTLEVQEQERSPELLGQPSAASRDLRSEALSMDGSGGGEGLTAPTSLENPPAMPRVISSGASTAEGFAQDLLVQEQRSKARITGELLLVRRKLDEERTAREALDRDLSKARAVLEDERARRTSAQDGLERLQSETEQLRQEHNQLRELREEHGALEAKHEAAEVELGALLQSATTLEAGQGHLRMDLQRACSDEARVKVQLAEAQARLLQAQERIESLQRRHADARQAAEIAQEAVERQQRELSSERAVREQLDDQATLLRADAERAWHGERAAKEALAAARAQQTELQTQITKCREDASSSRCKAKEARERLEGDSEEAERVRGAGGRFVEALRAYADCWARGLSEGCPPHSSNMVSSKAAGRCSPHRTQANRTIKNVTVEAAVRTEGIETTAVPDDVAPPAADRPVLQEGAACPNDAAHLPSVVQPTSPGAAATAEEGVRPPVPLWAAPAAVSTAFATAKTQLALTSVAETVQLRGQQHGMASLMVGSQDSPPLVSERSPEKADSKEADAPRLVKVDAAAVEAASVQRMASASILTLVTPPSKRSVLDPPVSVGRKRVRTR